MCLVKIKSSSSTYRQVKKQGRWFNSIRAWKVERPSQNAGMQPQPADYSFPPVSSAPVPPADFSATDDKDDLPF